MIVITGASDGLGKQLARIYKEAGQQVVNISRSECEYADVNITLSLREGPEIQQAADQIAALGGTLDAIIHNAGVESLEPMGQITEDEIKRLMSTNVKPQILLTSMLLDRINKDGTDIVCVSSTSGTQGVPGHIVYSTSKWAVRGFAKNLQEVFKGKPNRVISFVPGGFKSSIVEKITGDPIENPQDWMDPQYVAMFIKQILDLPKNMQVTEVILSRKVVD